MSKKFFIGLLVISLVALAGGCESSNSPITNTTDVDTALKGAWTSSNNGTTTITSTNTDSKNDLKELEALFESYSEIPGDVREQYEAEKKRLQEENTVVPVNATVASAVFLFDDCNISGDSGTAKLTAVVILSGDSLFVPICYNGVAISTQRNNINEWTATTPDGGTLSINMESEEKINLSGKVHYLDYDCEFSTVIDKNLHNSINPTTILDGTWKLSETQGGGCLAIDSKITSAVIPDAVSIYFKDTKEDKACYVKSVIL